MRIKVLIVALLTILASKTVVKCDTVSSRRFASCGYMSGKIYCYGGITSVIVSNSVENTLYSLSIDQFSGQTLTSINSKWESVQPAVPFNTEQRRLPNAVVLSDGKRMLINGGYGDTAKYVNQTIIYDSTTNTWQTGSAYSESPRGIRQMYSSSLLNLPNNFVGFFGGYEQFANRAYPQITASGAAMPIWDDNGTAVGFVGMQTYSPGSKNWAAYSPQTNLPANYYTQAQTATLDPTSGKVYFLGGTYYTPAKDDATPIGFHWTFTFDTNSGLWQNLTLSGTVYPQPRQYHTSDLLPNSRDIIMYGGTDNKDDEKGKAVSDYCFTLNLVDNTWTEHNLNVPPDSSGPRFSHSSVLVNSTLLILFGKGADSTMLQSMLAVNVANVSNLSYSATFGAPSDAASLPTESNSPGSSNQSKGIIGGIVAGAAVAIIAILAAIVFFVRKRRRDERRRRREIQDKEANEQVPVDWDTLDNHFREISPVGWSVTNSPHSANLTDLSSKRESYSNRFSSTYNVNDGSVTKPSLDTDRSAYPVVKPDAI